VFRYYCCLAIFADWLINQCKPAFRVWPDEKCERCEKFGLPCGPNVSSKESREDSVALGSGSPEVLPEDDEYDLLSPNLTSFEDSFIQVMRQANPPSQHIHVIDQSAAFEGSNAKSSTSTGPYPTKFLNLTAEPSRTQSNVAISKTSQRADELQERSESFPAPPMLLFPDLEQASYA
jgi:hypothetical protein